MPAGNMAVEDLTKQYLALQRKNSEMAAQIKAYDESYNATLQEKNRAQQEKMLLERQMKDLNEKVNSLGRETKSRDTTSKSELEKARSEVKMVSDLLEKTTNQLTESTKVMDSLLKEKESLQATQRRLENEIDIIKRDKPDEFKKLLADKDTAQKSWRPILSRLVKEPRKRSICARPLRKRKPLKRTWKARSRS